MCDLEIKTLFNSIDRGEGPELTREQISCTIRQLKRRQAIKLIEDAKQATERAIALKNSHVRDESSAAWESASDAWRRAALAFRKL